MYFIIDSYAWIEYFIGSEKGEVLRKLFTDERNQFYTVECCFAEIMGWALKNNRNFDELFKIIRADSTTIVLTEHDWIDAGKERFEQRKRQRDFGLIDAVLLVKQKELGCKIISGDQHFKNLKNVVFLE
jgi:predicted nucleic acid-binding protein